MKIVANKCSCDDKPGISGHSIVFNFSGATRRIDWSGEDTLVVPLVMLMETVVNGAYVAANELIPESWNGVPVTIRHPTDGKGFISANDPATIVKVQIGRIFNATVSEGKLKAEAWISVAKANSVYPGIVDYLEAGKPMDVSTGYFSRSAQVAGTYNGKAYTATHTDLKPDHLALLPDESGACSWQDGCGVRANGDMGMQVNEAIQTLMTAAGWKGGGDIKAMIAELIACKESPFSSVDQKGLEAMGVLTIQNLHDAWITKKGADMTTNTNNQPKVLVAADLEKLGIDKDTATRMIEAQTKKEEKVIPPNNQQQQPTALPTDAAGLTAFIGNAVAESMKLVLPSMLKEQNRPQLLAKVIAHTHYTKEVAEKMDTATLEVIANGIKIVSGPTPNFGGRNTPVVNASGNDDNKRLAAMVPQTITQHLNSQKQNGKAN